MSEEKRGAPRYLFSEPVDYGFPEVAVNGSIAGNISLSGIALRVQEFIPVGSVLELKLSLGRPSPKIIWVKAQVVRIREILSNDCYEIGLRFLKDEKCTKAIGTYIDFCRFESTKELENYG